jgi:hypothetical protein
MRFFVALLLRMRPINAVSGWALVNETGRKNSKDKTLILALKMLQRALTPSAEGGLGG